MTNIMCGYKLLDPVALTQYDANARRLNSKHALFYFINFDERR